MNRLLLLVVALAAVMALQYWNRQSANDAAGVADTAPVVTLSTDGDALARAYANHASGVMVSGAGTVTRILDDDNAGGRHQRFILALASGQTLLVAHNIDLAPRVEALREGDTVSFRGEYEWNDRGGVVHWTHHDPEGRHQAGWLRHGGRTYE